MKRFSQDTDNETPAREPKPSDEETPINKPSVTKKGIAKVVKKTTVLVCYTNY